jgi:hypothetical protein
MTLTNELNDFEVNQHFIRLGLDQPHSSRPLPARINRFKRIWRQIGSRGI